jgi:O-antigen polymerase
MFVGFKNQLNLIGPAVVLGLFYLVIMHTGLLYRQIGGSGLLLPVNSLAWVMLCLSLIVLLFVRSDAQFYRVTSWHRGLCLVLFMLFVPLIYGLSDYDLDTLGRVAALAGGALLVFLLQQLRLSEIHWSLIFAAIVTGGLLEGVVGIYQLISGMQGLPYGSFLQQNNTGSFVLSAFVASLWLANAALSPVWVERGSLALSRCLLVLAFMMALVSGFVVLTLLSRGTWLAALIILVLTLLKAVVFRGRQGLVLFGLLCVFAVSGFLGWSYIEGGYASNANAEKFDTRYALPSGLRDKALANDRVGELIAGENPRETYWRVAYSLIKDAPLAGVGYGNFMSAFRDRHAQLYASGFVKEAPKGYVFHPHNELLYWFIEGGLIAFLGILLFVVLILRHLLKAKRSQALLLFSLFVPYGVHSMLEFPFYHYTAQWLTFCLFVALVTGIIPQGEKVSELRVVSLPASLLRFFVLFVLVVYIGVMAMNIRAHHYYRTFMETGRFQALTGLGYAGPYNDLIIMEAMMARGQAALASGNAAELAAFDKWADYVSDRLIYDFVYERWVRVLLRQGEREKALQVLDQARHYYPDSVVIKRLDTLIEFPAS